MAVAIAALVIMVIMNVTSCRVRMRRGMLWNSDFVKLHLDFTSDPFPAQGRAADRHARVARSLSG
eukprot:3229762-Pyramimonas_sp.AAC.1